MNKRFKSEPGPRSQTQEHSQETLGKVIRGPLLEDCGRLADDMNQWKLLLKRLGVEFHSGGRLSK